MTSRRRRRARSQPRRASHAGSSASVSTAVPTRSVTHPKPTASPVADASPRKVAYGARDSTINTIAAATRGVFLTPAAAIGVVVLARDPAHREAP
jgi:hypothetical protein